MWFGGHNMFGETETVRLGGVVSRTVTRVVAVELRPPVSVTVSVKACVPSGTGTFGTSAVFPPGTLLPFSSFHWNVSESPSGSVEDEPSRATGVPLWPLHATVRSGPAFATGGRLAPLTKLVTTAKFFAPETPVLSTVRVSVSEVPSTALEGGRSCTVTFAVLPVSRVAVGGLTLATNLPSSDADTRKVSVEPRF